MLLVSAIINRTIRLFLPVTLLMATSAFSQENSPYSRYGLGDQVPNASIISRGMGGISAGFADYDSRYDFKQIYPKSQSINFLNPASYGRTRITSFDLGFEIDNRILRSNTEAEKYKSTNAIISYLQLALPLSRKHNIGMTLGLRPVTRISYKVLESSRTAGIDSVQQLYQGNGGSYEAFVGFGKSFKKFSFGFNTGYFFGSKNYSTKKQFVPDSSDINYSASNYENNTTFGGVFFQAGTQYSTLLNMSTRLTIGVYGNLKRNYTAHKNLKAETFFYGPNGGVIRIDSVYTTPDVDGKITTPAQLGVGFTLERLDKWLIGADFITTQWQQYRFFGLTEPTQNSWTFKVGGQYIPNPYDPKSYWSRVTYRLGFNLGQDYLKVDKNLPFFNTTAGIAFPVRKNPYTNQYSNINLALEYGKRGNNSNSIRENYFRVALGLSLSDLWFVKRKYD